MWLILFSGVGCRAKAEGGGETPVSWTTLDFPAACRPGPKVSLAVGDSARNPAVIDRIKPLPNGGFLTADPQAGRILFFDSLGRSVRVMGRVGDGPGEYRAPTDAALLNDTLIAVVDIQRMLVTVLDTGGRYLHSFPTPRLGGHRLIGTSDRRIAVAGLYDIGGSNQLLAIYDDSGRFSQSAVEFPELIANSSPRIDDAVLAVTSQGSLVYVSAVLPRVWLLDGTSIRTISFTPSKAWLQIQPLKTRPGRLQEVRDWIASGSFITGGGLANDSVLWLGWRNGVTTDGPDYLAAVSLTRRSMVLVENLPGRVVGVQGARVALVVEEGGAANVLAWFACDRALGAS